MTLRILSFTILLILTAASVFGQEHTNRTVFVSKSNFDEFSRINQTTGIVQRQYFYPGFYFTGMESEKHYIWESGKNAETYGTGPTQWTTIDYDDDGYLDLFGFVTRNTDLPVGSDYPGMLFIRNDFLNNPIDDFTEVKYLEQTDIFEYGRSLLADIDNDGNLEIFSNDNDHHIRPDGSSLWRGGISMHNIINDTTIHEYRIGVTTLSHDFALGDIDNDGDIDLIYFLLPDSDNDYDLEIPRSIPQIMMNDGLGNFYEVNTFDYFKHLEDISYINVPGVVDQYKSWTITSFDLMDLNNDDILDIVNTYTHNHCVEPTSKAELCENGTEVYWGQGGGYFDMNDKSVLPIDYLFDIGSKISAGGDNHDVGEVFSLGHTFLDFNKDGHLDIVNGISLNTPNTPWGYDGWSIQLIRNNGDRSFDDVTSTYVFGAPRIDDIDNMCSDFDFPTLHDFVPYDIDNDGDYDLLPDLVGGWNGEICSPEDLVFFENRNGVFHFSSRSYPDKVSLSSPSDQLTGVSLAPTLSWTEDTNSDIYTLQVSTDGFESFVVNESLSDTSFTTPELGSNTTYSWRVRGSNSAGDGDWSETWTFTTQYSQLSSSTPLNPQDGQDNVGTLTDFRWSEVDSVESYQLQVTTDSTFTTQMFQSEEIDSTTFTLTDPIRENTQYFWRVRSLGEVEQQHSEWSEVMSFTTGVRTSVEADIPTDYALNQNYPNPFNPTTTITYSLPQSGMVTLNIYDITGRFITTLVNGVKGAGVHSVEFDASTLSSGMYVYTLETDGYRQTRQMMLVK